MLAWDIRTCLASCITMALKLRTYHISPSRTWTLLKSYQWSTGRMGFKAFTPVPRVMGGATGSHRVQRHRPNLAMAPMHPPPHLPRVCPPVKEFARSCQQSEFRMLLCATLLGGRSRQPVLTHHQLRSCAPRQALPTLPLRWGGEALSLKMGKQRQQFARTAKRRTRHCGGGIRRGSLCVSGFAEHNMRVQG